MKGEKIKLNSREIINNLLCGNNAERVGLYDSPWGDTIQKWVENENYPVAENKQEYRVEEQNKKMEAVNPVDHFKFDMCEVLLKLMVYMGFHPSIYIEPYHPGHDLWS